MISSLVDLWAARDVAPIVRHRLSIFIQLSCVLQKPVTIKAPTRVSTPVPVGPALQVVFVDAFVHVEYWSIRRDQKTH